MKTKQTKKQSSSMKNKHTKKNITNQNENENSFSILSFNIYSRGCKSFNSKIVDKLIKDNNIDVLCSQEDGGKNIYKPISNYKILPVIKNKSCGNKSFETVGVYEKIPNSINLLILSFL